jgi:hypothetical protein
MDTQQTDYMRFRGKCRKLSEAALASDPTLTLVRGYYFCPIWNSKEAHWWTVRSDGTIYDPSAKQFPSGGLGTYEEFSGMLECAECGKEIPEEGADIESNYAFCSPRCHMRFVGL